MENKDLELAPEQQKRAYVYSGFSQADHNIQLPGKPLSKVPIGTAYHPAQRHQPTWEELEIQHYLLKQPRRRRLSDGFVAFLYFAACTALLWWLF